MPARGVTFSTNWTEAQEGTQEANTYAVTSLGSSGKVSSSSCWTKALSSWTCPLSATIHIHRAVTPAATLPPEAVTAAQEHGRSRDLEAAIAELLMELETVPDGS